MSACMPSVHGRAQLGPVQPQRGQALSCNTLHTPRCSLVTHSKHTQLRVQPAASLGAPGPLQPSSPSACPQGTHYSLTHTLQQNPHSHTRSHRLMCQQPRAGAHALGSSSSESPGEGASPTSSLDQPSSSYTLADTRALVETAMLAAVSGLAYLLSTILKLENTLGYFLPLPVVLAALRSGVWSGWKTMTATGFLLIVLLGPLRAATYVCIHGLMAATLGSLWAARVPFWGSVAAGAAVRMAGQFLYLVLSSATMNENLFALMLSNIYNMLDQVTAALGMTGAPSPLAVICMLGSMLAVNSTLYCFLLHVVYRVVLGAMGYQLGPLPGFVQKYLYAGAVQREGSER